MPKKWAITDLNALNGSQDIPSESKEFEHFYAQIWEFLCLMKTRQEQIQNIRLRA